MGNLLRQRAVQLKEVASLILQQKKNNDTKANKFHFQSLL